MSSHFVHRYTYDESYYIYVHIMYTRDVCVRTCVCVCVCVGERQREEKERKLETLIVQAIN